MSDRILLRGMRFEGRHGVGDDERALSQILEVDLEVEADLAPAGRSDDLSKTIDYGPLVAICRAVVEDEQARLLEAIAEAIAARVLSTTPATAATVRVRKLAVPIDADMDYAEIEILREREPSVA